MRILKLGGVSIVAGTATYMLTRLYFSYRMHKDLHDDVIDEKY